jgi:CHAD domain-containing protein
MTQLQTLHGALHEMLGGMIDAGSHFTDHAVHVTRKTLKRARAALRLMKAAMGAAAYRSANQQLRDAARPLTPMRDAVALLDALKTTRKTRDNKRLKRYAGLVHRALLNTHRLDREELTGERLRFTGEKLRAVDLKIAPTSGNKADAASARRGLKMTFRSGRKAFSSARKHPTVALLHEWRKQAKYLANEIELAEQIGLLKFKRQRRQAERLGEVLGDDHDLALLSAKLRVLSRDEIPGCRSQRKRFEQRIKKKRHKLQQIAHRLGERLYGAPVEKFNRSLKKRLVRP